jgi:hypothetical protein
VTHGVYLVTGQRAYRGHQPGVSFTARLDRNAEARAIRRGDLQLLDRVTPALEPGTYTFPHGWLASPTSPDHRGAERRLTRSERE